MDFWFINDSGKIGISHLYLLNFLKNNGFYRHYIDLKQWVLVRIVDRIIDEVEYADAKNFVLNYILGLDKEIEPNKFKIYEHVHTKSTHFFGKEFIETLSKTSDIKGFYLMADTNTHSFKYFSNCVIIIDKKGIKEIPYADLYGFVWKGQILKRKWIFGESNTIFKKFIWKIAGEKAERAEIFKSIIGYYLWTYKNPSHCPSVVLTDEVLNTGACGRTGKGLFYKAISKILNVISFDGKSFDFNKSFLWQRVNLDTDLIIIEDCTRHFDFEKMFSLITEGMPIEKKNMKEFFISFENSPRFGITTNYALKGETDSFKARLIEVELCKYFSAKLTPEMEFGHIFFNSWDETEWSKFDNFMVECIIFYMKNGLKQPSNEYYGYKKILNTLGEDIFEYFEDMKRNYWYTKSELKNELKKISDHKMLGSRKIREFLESYCNYKGLEFIEGRSADVRCIMFKEKEYTIEKEEVKEQTEMPF